MTYESLVFGWLEGASLNPVWNNFKAFWNAEEVPRWFGLSLVIVYLTGLGAVAHCGITGARRQTVVHLEWTGRYTVEFLADRLRLAGHEQLDCAAVTAAYQRELATFAVKVPTRSVRIVNDSRQVIASSDPEEIGTVAAAGATAHNSERLVLAAIDVPGQDVPDTLVRVPLSVGGRGTADEARLFLEARLLPAPHESSSVVAHADTLAVVLVAFGVLFGLYRCLRGQLRGMSRIADRLRSHCKCLGEDLASLRIGDTLDSATTAWNDLVGLTESLHEAVQRTEANQELQRALERSCGGALSEALHAIPDGIVYVTDEVRFEYLNSTASRLFGWDPEECRRVTLSEAQAEDPGGRILELLREALRPDGSFDARTEVVEVDEPGPSERSSYRVLVIPLHRAHHEGECVVLIRDASQQMRADRAREDFVTQVTHELRTPLTNIRAYAETLSSGMFEDPQVITECYNVITKETRRLSRLIEDILSVSQLEVGSIDLHLDRVDLKALLGDGVRDVRGLADEKNIDLQLLLPPKMESIRGDRDKLAVVVNNLLGNAIKYTPPGGNILVGCQFAGDKVAITVKDNGIGIDPEDHGRIFEKFQRAHDPEVQNEAGTGIGLYTAREIARRHGGDIELISQKGEGSTFLVRLPHRESRAIALSTPEEA